jgi:hypothetical protein
MLASFSSVAASWVTFLVRTLFALASNARARISTATPSDRCQCESTVMIRRENENRLQADFAVEDSPVELSRQKCLVRLFSLFAAS